MKSNTLYTLVVISSLFFGYNGLAQTPEFNTKKVTSHELQTAIGDWEGSLTYIDYSSGKPYTMPANLIIRPGKNENELILQNLFPNEPKANNTEKIVVSKDGRKLNGKSIASKEVQSNGNLLITTVNTGRDNKRKAVIKYIYVLGKTDFRIIKQVQFEDTDTWLKRSEFSYSRSSRVRD